MSPKISVIIPLYNGERFIGNTIESVLAQTEQDFELLVVDDCSTDGGCRLVEAFAEKDPRVQLLRQPVNSGAAAARNAGVERARGRYISYLDSDDLWKPEKLARELELMEAKEAAFVFSGYEFADENAVGLGIIVRVPESLNYRQALGNTTIFTSTVMFDTRLIPRELIKMPLVKSEDTACWWRILRNGYTAYGLNENLVLYRRTRGTLSSNKGEAIRRIWYLYRKVEGLSLIESMRYFCLYAIRAVLRRV